LIGLNVLGLVYALTTVVGGILQMAPIVALAGFLIRMALGVLAAWRTDKSLKRMVR
jgi:hypothetical protein